jgi:hypothetical protein
MPSVFLDGPNTRAVFKDEEGPPGRVDEAPPAPPSNRGQRVLKVARAYNQAAPRASYWRLLTERYSQGLLQPFACFRCGVLGLDPLGWDGPRRPLCASCADGEGVS